MWETNKLKYLANKLSYVHFLKFSVILAKMTYSQALKATAGNGPDTVPSLMIVSNANM